VLPINSLYDFKNLKEPTASALVAWLAENGFCGGDANISHIEYSRRLSSKRGVGRLAHIGRQCCAFVWEGAAREQALGVKEWRSSIVH
jgi:hypothetical protein